MAVALHLAEALHHSSGASLEPVAERREVEVEAEVVYDAPRGQEQPPPGMRPGSLSDPGPPQQVAATVGYVAAGAPRLTPVVLVQDAALDDKTVAWLLERSLAEQQREEEEAVEAAVLAELEEKVAVAEGRLLVELQRERAGGSRISRQTCATLSRVEQLAVELRTCWSRGGEEEEEEEEEEEDETQEKLVGGRYFFAPLFLTVTCLTLVLHEEYGCFFREIPSRGFPYSALGGSSVDSCLRQFTVAFVVDFSAMAGFAGDDALRAVFLFAVAWPQILGIIAGMHQKDSYALFGPGSGLCKGILHLALCSSRGFLAQMPCRQARR